MVYGHDLQVSLDNIFLSKTAFIIYFILVSMPYIFEFYFKLEDKYKKWKNKKSKKEKKDI